MKYVYSMFFFLLCSILLGGCYSFTGGSIPSHLKTLEITSITDNSGFGNPAYKTELEQLIKENFIKDNSFDITENSGDAVLRISIASIQESVSSVSTGELETERKITVSCKVEYYDNVNKKSVWNKDFSSYGFYALQQTFTARNETVSVVLKQIAEDIMLSVVSGW